MGAISTQNEKSGLRGWTTRDLLVTAVIAIAFGLVTVGLNYISAMLMAVNPAFISLLSGFYSIPMILAMYIVRRPGTAVLAIVIGALVTLAFNPFGWMESAFAVIYGIVAELPFLLTRYRDFRLRILFLSGAAVSFLSFTMLYLFGGLSGILIPVQLLSFVVFIVSGALIGGWLSKLLADALARTGVLSGFAIAATYQEEI